MEELIDLAIVLGLVLGLGWIADRLGQSPIPAYFLGGVLLGPNGPGELGVVEPSEPLQLLADLGLIFILFFLGLEFSFDRVRAAGRFIAVGGTTDLLLGAAAGVIAGVLLVDDLLAVVVIAAAVYVSSSGIIVKALSDFRRLADRETDLILAVLVVEDVIIAFFLAVVGTLLLTGDASTGETVGTVAIALAALVIFGLLARRLSRLLSRALERLEREFFIIGTGAIVVGIAVLFEEIGLSIAFGAIMAGVLFSDSPVRSEIEERFFSFRDLFGAVFFFVFGLSVNLAPIFDSGRIVALALAGVALAIVAKIASGVLTGRFTGLALRRGVSAGNSLVARGEFSLVLGQLALAATVLSVADRELVSAFIGVLVVVTAVVGVVTLQYSKRIGRAVEARFGPREGKIET